jgi:hypothetical protein
MASRRPAAAGNCGGTGGILCRRAGIPGEDCSPAKELIDEMGGLQPEGRRRQIDDRL